jgi:hypothetical protein
MAQSISQVSQHCCVGGIESPTLDIGKTHSTIVGQLLWNSPFLPLWYISLPKGLNLQWLILHGQHLGDILPPSLD